MGWTLFKKLRPGMVAASDVYVSGGSLLVAKGSVLTDDILNKLSVHSVYGMNVEHEEEIDDMLEKMEVQQPEVKEEHSYSDRVKASPEFQEFCTEFEEAVGSFENFANNIVQENSVEIDVDDLLKQSMGSLILDHGSRRFPILDMMQNMRNYDDVTFVHSMNVALICNIFARWMNFSEEDAKMATACGLLHDIGKLKIPDSIIKKNGPLTDAEYGIIKTHPITGYDILKKTNVDKHIRNAALEHHEKNDGSGYPMQLKGKSIDNYSAIVAIADVYDALTAARQYRGPLCPFRAIEIFEEDGFEKYHPGFIMKFLENVVNTYLQSDCMLSDGSRGKIVYINTKKFSRPMVKVKDEYIDLSSGKYKHLSIESML